MQKKEYVNLYWLEMFRNRDLSKIKVMKVIAKLSQMIVEISQSVFLMDTWGGGTNPSIFWLLLDSQTRLHKVQFVVLVVQEKANGRHDHQRENAVKDHFQEPQFGLGVVVPVDVLRVD